MRQNIWQAGFSPTVSTCFSVAAVQLDEASFSKPSQDILKEN
jgi:hypothetical protein